MRNRPVLRYCHLLSSMTFFALVGCTDSGKMSISDATVLDKNWLTASVLAQLDPSGRFPSTAPATDNTPAVSLLRAKALADAFVHTFGSSSSMIWSQDAGVPVEGGSLRQCDRVDFVESAYDAIPASQNDWFRNAWGPQWIVRLCQRTSVPIVELTVAANASNIQITDAGTLPFGAYSAIFVAHGIPQGTARAPSIEDAAEAVARANRTAQISQLPSMVGIGAGISPWRTSFLFEQTGTGGIRTVTTAVGLTRSALQLRPSRGSSIELDTLYDLSPTGVAVPVLLRRRSTAIAKSDVRQIFLGTGGSQ